MMSKNLYVCLSVTVFSVDYVCKEELNVHDIFWQEIITLTRPICRGVWNFPRKFHLYLIFVDETAIEEN